MLKIPRLPSPKPVTPHPSPVAISRRVPGQPRQTGGAR